MVFDPGIYPTPALLLKHLVHAGFQVTCRGVVLHAIIVTAVMLGLCFIGLNVPL